LCEIAPGPRSSLWLYVTVGASDLRQERSLEFILACPAQAERGVELVTMVARYHRTEGLGLGLGHTLPIGEPWLPGATCDFLLVSLPYPWGPELQVGADAEARVHILWLLPIAAAERTYESEHGQEALEVLFDENKLQFWNLRRPSVVGLAR
jgi:Suppressor of fused protein (SUFU)